MSKGKTAERTSFKRNKYVILWAGVHVYQYKSGRIWLQRIWITALKQAPGLSYTLVTKLLINSELLF